MTEILKVPTVTVEANAPSLTATIPKKSYSRLPSAARVTKATLRITHGHEGTS